MKYRLTIVVAAAIALFSGAMIVAHDSRYCAQHVAKVIDSNGVNTTALKHPSMKGMVLTLDPGCSSGMKWVKP